MLCSGLPNRLCCLIADFPYNISVLRINFMGVHLMEEHNLSQTVAKKVRVSLLLGKCIIESLAILLLPLRLKIKDLSLENA
jgi:hypothetical protein